MKLTRAIVEKRLPLFNADALFGGQVSGWLEGEPIPRKFKSRLEQMFLGWTMDGEDEPAQSAPIPEEKKQPTKPKTRKRRK